MLGGLVLIKFGPASPKDQLTVLPFPARYMYDQGRSYMIMTLQPDFSAPETSVVP